MPTNQPYYEDHDIELHQGDALTILDRLPSESVNCIVTSPPYYGLRDYGMAGQIGLEGSPKGYVDALRDVFAEARRVLTGDGVLWLNLGDTYSTGSNGTNGTSSSTLVGHGGDGSEWDRGSAFKRGRLSGIPPKNLLGMPWRVAFSLQDDGWILRNDTIWAKPNAMPESVTDRLSCKHEYLFLFAKSQRYRFDLDAIKVPTTGMVAGNSPEGMARYGAAGGTDNSGRRFGGNPGSTLLEVHETRNPGDVWSITTKPFPGAHFAVMPPDLVQPCILAGCPTEGTVLDPFAGSGTVLKVARSLGRKSIGIELNPEYCAIAVDRIGPSVLDFSEPVGAH